MERNIYKIGKELFITSDEEIKEGDWYLTFTNNEVMGQPRKCEDTNWNFSHCKKIILTTDQDLIADGVQAIDDEFLEWFVQNPSCEEVEVELVALNEHGSEISVNSYGFEKFGYKIIIPKEEVKKIYYNTVGRENGVNVVKGQFNTQKEALDLANELNRKYPDLYYDWRKTLIKEEPKQETLEEAAENHINNDLDLYESLTDGHISYDIGMDLLHKLFIAGAKWQSERMYSEEEVYSLLCSMPNFYNMTIPQQVKARDKWFEQFKKK